MKEDSDVIPERGRGPAATEGEPLPPVSELRHYARRSLTDMGGAMEVVDRQFDFVRCILPYDYRWTSNSQQWSEAERICQALEGPMIAQGVVRVSPADTPLPTPDGRPIPRTPLNPDFTNGDDR